MICIINETCSPEIQIENVIITTELMFADVNICFWPDSELSLVSEQNEEYNEL